MSRPALIMAVRIGLDRQRPSPAVTADGPRDCVLKIPTLSPDVVELAAFDSTGTVRYRISIEVSEDVQLWQQCLLRRMRRRYPARNLTLLG